MAEELEGGDITAADMILPEEEPSEIKNFYDGSILFITGASGFLGNVLLEKLLRTCSGIKKVYILMRPKKGKDVLKRFDEIFNNEFFDRIRAEQPEFVEKLSIVYGDCGSKNLGLSHVDRETLVREVDIVFHVAATVKFDEKLGTAVNINVRGTRDLLQMAKEMKHLRAFVHVSTAYSNCNKISIDEKFYDTTITCNKLLQITDTLDDEQMDAITPLLLKSMPNTYVFTKAIAENVIKEYGKGLPVAIVRPSIVVATAKEPIAGWINNLYGATGVAVGAAVGLLRTLHCNPNFVADLVPADFCINTIIAAAWQIGTVKGDNLNKEIYSKGKSFDDIKLEDDIPIYNYISSSQNPITWKQFMKLTEQHAFKIPSPATLWHYFLLLNPNKFVHILCVYLLHLLPGLIVDALAILTGKKPMLTKAYKKINKFSDVISYFSCNQWNFHNNNTQSLFKQMNKTDKKQFDFDMSALDWNDYFHTYTRGMRVYILKDPMETLPQGQSKFIKLKIAHYTLVTLVFLGMFKLLSMIFFAILW